MTEIEAALQRIRTVADRKGGLAILAREADVPYTTVHSFSERDWSHKNLEVIEKLVAAADRIAARDDDAGEPQGAAA
jgi:precorrin-6B methylase 1